jgi:hypothetical protein
MTLASDGLECGAIQVKGCRSGRLKASQRVLRADHQDIATNIKRRPQKLVVQAAVVRARDEVDFAQSQPLQQHFGIVLEQSDLHVRAGGVQVFHGPGDKIRGETFAHAQPDAATPGVAKRGEFFFGAHG